MLTPSKTFNAGQWYMITYTADSDGAEAFIDGVSVGTQAGDATLNFGSSASGNIGEDYVKSAGRGMDGLMDEFGIWSRVLTDPEITALYNGGAGLAYPFVTDTCTYSSGNWDVTCSDNCSITENVNLGGNNLTLSADFGNLTVLANISNYDKIFIDPPLCKINIYPGIGGFGK